MNLTTTPQGVAVMNPEKLLEHAAAVKAAHDGEHDRARRKLDRLDKKIATGAHDHLEPLRSKLAAAAGGR